MNDRTVLNPSLQKPQPDDQTVLNTAAIQAEGLRPGMKLKNGITILKKMDVPSGEADLYLCEFEGKKLVLKHYRQAQSLKKEVTEALKSIRSEYVARVYSVGTFLERNYEIDAYFPLGSLEGKKVLRVIDHCNVYLLVFGTYIPVALLGVGGTLGWILFGITAFFSVLGITVTAINVDGTNKFQVGCHLVNGWSIIAGVPRLLQTIGTAGLFWLVCGGGLYSAGSVIYSLGAEKKFSHSVFHLFCIAGTFCHFWCVYRYLIG